jgi:hypothetical protein
VTCHYCSVPVIEISKKKEKKKRKKHTKDSRRDASRILHSHPLNARLSPMVERDIDIGGNASPTRVSDEGGGKGVVVGVDRVVNNLKHK